MLSSTFSLYCNIVAFTVIVTDALDICRYDIGSLLLITQEYPNSDTRSVIFLGFLYLPVLGLYWADAACIGPVQAQYWQLTACLQGCSFGCEGCVYVNHDQRLTYQNGDLNDYLLIHI